MHRCVCCFSEVCEEVEEEMNVDVTVPSAAAAAFVSPAMGHWGTCLPSTSNCLILVGSLLLKKLLKTVYLKTFYDCDLSSDVAMCAVFCKWTLSHNDDDDDSIFRAAQTLTFDFMLLHIQ